MRARSSPLPTTEQVQICSLIQQRIITDIQALDSGDGIEDNLALLLVIIIRHFLQGNGTQFHELAVLGPTLGCIIGNVAFFCDLRPPAETNTTVDDARLDLVVQVRGILALGFVLGDVRFAGIRRDLVAHECFFTFRGDQFEGVHTKEFLSSEAGGEWLGRGDKGKGPWCFAEESFDRGWVLWRVRGS